MTLRLLRPVVFLQLYKFYIIVSILLVVLIFQFDNSFMRDVDATLLIHFQVLFHESGSKNTPPLVKGTVLEIYCGN